MGNKKLKKFRVGILGATGMVGQQFIRLLNNHPLFEVVIVAASSKSSGKLYGEATKNRWMMDLPLPLRIANLNVFSVENDIQHICNNVDFVFCALNMDENTIKIVENNYASNGIPVISNNSANRWTEDVPMIIPEVNADHLKLIDIQKHKRGWQNGFIVVKPNCSIQSYVIILTALKAFNPIKIKVVSLQAISGAGKTFKSWPEMIDNIIPNIDKEEIKSEKEPMKIWGKINKNKLITSTEPKISATCIRVPTSNGHMADISVSFRIKPSINQIFKAIKLFNNSVLKLNLPSSPKDLIRYFEENDRPQTKLDRQYGNGMGITMGKLQKDKFFDYKFIALSHNTIRGAAGGAILTAELLVNKGYIKH